MRNSSRNLHQRNNSGIRGSSRLDTGNFNAAVKNYDIYIGRVSLDVSADIIKSYVKNQLKMEIINCAEIESYYENRQSKSFKITVNEETRNQLLNAELWPKDVIVRKFTTKRNFYNNYWEDY